MHYGYCVDCGKSVKRGDNYHTYVEYLGRSEEGEAMHGLRYRHTACVIHAYEITKDAEQDEQSA